jgi:hypothetical protein
MFIAKHSFSILDVNYLFSLPPDIDTPHRMSASLWLLLNDNRQKASVSEWSTWLIVISGCPIIQEQWGWNINAGDQNANQHRHVLGLQRQSEVLTGPNRWETGLSTSTLVAVACNCHISRTFHPSKMRQSPFVSRLFPSQHPHYTESTHHRKHPHQHQLSTTNEIINISGGFINTIGEVVCLEIPLHLFRNLT